jgi:hypothetical protein
LVNNADLISEMHSEYTDQGCIFIAVGSGRPILGFKKIKQEHHLANKKSTFPDIH